MKRALTVISVILFCALLNIRGNAAVSTYTFSPDETSVPTATDLSFGVFQRQNVTAAPQGGTFRSSAWDTTSTIDLSEYVQFTITVAPGNQLTLASLSLYIASTKSNGANDGGPNNLRVSVLAGILALGSGDANAPLTSQNWSGIQNTKQTLNWDLPDQTSTAGFTVRLYGWNAENSSGLLSFDNVAVTTTVTPVPEPVTVAATSFGAAVFAIEAIRRQRRF